MGDRSRKTSFVNFMHILASFVPLGMDLLLLCKELEILPAKFNVVRFWI